MRMDTCLLRRSLPALALTVALLAGCGGNGASEEEYEAGLGRVQARLDEASEASRESGAAEKVEERRAKLGEAHEALDAAADEAERLDPPKEAREAHEDFARALREYADLFDRLARLQANDPRETELYTQAGEIAERLDKASRQLEEAGFEAEQQAADR